MEQQDQLTQPAAESPPVQDPNSERDELLKAVAEVEEPSEAAPKAEGKPAETKVAIKAEAEPKAESAPNIGKLARAIKERELARTQRMDAEKAKAEVAHERAELDKARREAATELARIQQLKSDPMAAIKELGWKSDDLVNNILQEGKPEWQAMQKLRAEMESLRSEQAELKQARDEMAQLRKHEDQSRQAAMRDRIYSEFLGKCSEDKTPNLRVLYEDREIIRMADDVADKYREATGQSADHDEIVLYLEQQASERAKRLLDKQKSSGTKGKTLSAAKASERRGAPRDVRDLDDPQEIRRALKEEADAILRTYEKG